MSQCINFNYGKQGSTQKVLLGLLVLLIISISSSASETKNLQVYTRSAQSLNGDWNYIVDPYENGYYDYRHNAFDQMENPPPSAYFRDEKSESPTDLIEYNFEESRTINVPGDWNTQNPQLYYYEGTVWYRKKFDSPQKEAGERVFLHFGAVNYRADVYLNSEKLGTHIGGFTPFYFEITDLLRSEENSLVVKVDNKRFKEAVPTENTDWWNYGGITRDVKLVVLPKSFIRDYKIQLNDHVSNQITGEIYLENSSPGEKVNLSIPELKIDTTIDVEKNGLAKFTLSPKKLELWSPVNPKLYRFEIKSDADQLIDSIGFRTVTTQGKNILLNGERVFLRGISIHEEYAAQGEGRVNAAWKAERLLGWADDLGCNFVRLAHYPHNEDMVRIAERKGIMVWSEIPVYWTIDWENEATYENAQKQLEENILRDRNRANIIIWSLANETPVNEIRTQFLSKLANRAGELDSSRLLSAAMEKHYKSDSVALVEDPLAEIVDILAFNQYIGWYDGLPEKCDWVSWEIPYNKPVFISEFGGGAKYGHHGNKNERWTEEYQEDLYVKTLSMLDRIDGLAGMSPWILSDFRSPRRPLPNIQDDFNRKGLLSEKGEKKKAYFVLQQYYKKKKP